MTIVVLVALAVAAGVVMFVIRGREPRDPTGFYE